MQNVFQYILNIFESIVNVFGTIGISDILDILIVAYLIYQLLKLARDTRAGQLIKGVFILFVVYLLVAIFQLNVLALIFQKVFEIGLIALVIIFQPEIRRTLERVGRSKFAAKFNFLNLHQESDEVIEKQVSNSIEIISNAAVILSSENTGALIIIERDTKLGDIIKTGTIIDSEPSVELIGNIFFPNTPLHDGATIMRDGKLYAAGCFLPLSQNNEISKQLGTRHRAALGVSETSDCIAIVVSEENGIISVAKNGVLTRGYDRDSLNRYLKKELIMDKETTFDVAAVKKKISFRKKKNKQ
jgi:diadenylate cyclase